MGWGVRDYPTPPENDRVPVCPVCGQDCRTIYRAHDFTVVGCDQCIDSLDAYMWMDEYL